MTIAEILQARGQAVENMRELNDRVSDEGRDFTSHEQKLYDGWNAEQAALKAQANREQGLLDLDSDLSQPATQHTPASLNNSPSGYSNAPSEYFRGKDGIAVPVYSLSDDIPVNVQDQPYNENRVGSFIRNLIRQRTSDPLVRNALEVGTDSEGGFTVPTILAPSWVDALRNASVVSQAGARTVPLSTMNTDIARLESDPTPTWKEEEAAYGESDPVFGKVSFTANKLTCIFKVSEELLEDGQNIDQMLEAAIAGAFGAELDRSALVGSGSSPEPQGIQGTAGIGSVSMGTNGAALSNYDPFVDAWLELAQSNADISNLAAIMSPRTRAAIMKLKDSDNNALQKPEDVAAIRMAHTANMPVDETQGSASNASSIIMGNFSHLMWGVRTSMNVRKLDQLFAANGQIGIKCYTRVDFQIDNVKQFAKIVGVIP